MSEPLTTSPPRTLWPGPSTEGRRRPRKDPQAVKATATAGVVHAPFLSVLCLCAVCLLPSFSNSTPPLPPLPRAPSCLRPTLLVQDTDPRCVDVGRGAMLCAVPVRHLFCLCRWARGCVSCVRAGYTAAPHVPTQITTRTRCGPCTRLAWLFQEHCVWSPVFRGRGW